MFDEEVPSNLEKPKAKLHIIKDHKHLNVPDEPLTKGSVLILQRCDKNKKRANVLSSLKEQRKSKNILLAVIMHRLKVPPGG